MFVALPGFFEVVTYLSYDLMREVIRRFLHHRDVLLFEAVETDPAPSHIIPETSENFPYETVRKGVRATLRAWIWVVYGG